MENYDTLNYSAALLGMLIGLIVTGVMYGVFPFFFIRFRKTSITVKKLRRILILSGITVHILSSALVGTPEAAGRITPIFIWTGLYIYISKKVLRRKGLLIENRNTVQSEETVQAEKGATLPDIEVNIQKSEDLSSAVSCVSCGAELTNGDVFCKQCGTYQIVKKNSSPIRFCRRCGRELKEESHFCSFCGEEVISKGNVVCSHCQCKIPDDSTFCQFCGCERFSGKESSRVPSVLDDKSEAKVLPGSIPTKQQNHSSKKRQKIALCIVMLTILAYVVTNIALGKNAETNGNYILAQTCFDNLLIADTVVPEYMKYINAGVWMNNGNMYQAYLGFEDSAYDIPQRAWESLYSQMYSEGVRKYNKGFYSTSEWFFERANHFSRSDDYLFLLQCRSDNPPYNAVSRLKELFVFANAKDMLVYSMPIASTFLDGFWKSDSHRFQVDNSGDNCIFYWDFPQNSFGESIYISDGVLSVGNTALSSTPQFEITVVGINTITIYCYANGKEYTLYRSI